MRRGLWYVKGPDGSARMLCVSLRRRHLDDFSRPSWRSARRGMDIQPWHQQGARTTGANLRRVYEGRIVSRAERGTSKGAACGLKQKAEGVSDQAGIQSSGDGKAQSDCLKTEGRGEGGGMSADKAAVTLSTTLG